MTTTPFSLEDRFEVTPALNLVSDRTTGKETRLEGRLMNLLCLLVENEGQLVSREVITREIWNDYGNADEGLTQSISYLRKVMSDDQKKLIETVPKKGYVLRATVSEIPSNRQLAPAAIKPNRRSRSLVAVLITGLIGLMVFAVLWLSKKDEPRNSDLKPDMESRGTDNQIPSSNNSGADVVKRDSGSSLIEDSMKK